MAYGSLSGGGSYGGSSGTNSSTSSGNSFSNSDSISSGSSSASSGAKWSPEQLQRINELYPRLMADYQSASQQQPWADALTAVGGANQVFNPLTAFPTITEGPIWSSGDIQARVNQSRAQNDMGAAGLVKQAQGRAAAGGYGGNSPLLQELTTGIQGRNLATNTGAENDLRWGAAEGNAKHLLNTQNAGVQRATALNSADLARSLAQSEDDIRRRQLTVSQQGQRLQADAHRQNSLLQALGQYNNPLPFSKSQSVHRTASKSNSGSSQESSSSGTQNSNSGSWQGAFSGDSF